MRKIVFLDRNSLAPSTQIRPLQQAVDWVDYPHTAPHQVAERSQDAEILVLSKTPITAETLAACPQLRHIAIAATGFNIVDVDACSRHGVGVSNVTAYAGTSISEHVLGMIFSLRRELIQYRQQVINNRWQDSPAFCLFDKPLFDLKGATLGVIGLGELGTATAKLAHAVGMQVIFTARREIQSDFAKQVSLDELLSTADVVSVHCSLNSSTHNLIDTPQLEQMKKSAILINTARGGIVNEQALAAAIEGEEIAGTGVDVLAEEPPKNDSLLLSIANRNNVIITPHMAWTSQQAMQLLADKLADNIDAHLAGKPINLVNQPQ
ncbi:MAG: D-2-hydroxyacid dehydrogenase [Pseudomonadota bacterium]